VQKPKGKLTIPPRHIREDCLFHQMHVVGESMVSNLRVRAFPFLAAWLVFQTACSTDDVSRTNPTIPAANTAAQLRAGDSLTVSVQSVPEPGLSSVQIDREGFISLPYIGTVVAAGATT